jgi:hypothetical protein
VRALLVLRVECDLDSRRAQEAGWVSLARFFAAALKHEEAQLQVQTIPDGEAANVLWLPFVCSRPHLHLQIRQIGSWTKASIHYNPFSTET